MSATGRGTTRDPKDFYATPKVAFEPLLRFLPEIAFYWEPCAGDGRIISWLRSAKFVADGADLFPQAAAGYNPVPVDYLKDDTQRDFVITNPPFSVAFEMCQHARTHAEEFMFLLRLSFLESETRGAWFEKNEPSALFVLKSRPAFVMSITCKSEIVLSEAQNIRHVCKHNWLLPVESERPKVCPVCGGTRLAISTTDNSGYAWFYWGDRFHGIRHI